MHRRALLAGLAAGGGLLGAAFLQAAVAFASPDVVGPSATGADAFTIGGYTFDPFTDPNPEDALDQVAPSGVLTEGFSPVAPFSSAPPLLTLGGGSTSGLYLASQYLEVYSPSGTDLGTIDGGENVANLAGFTNTEFTVNDVFPATGATNADLPAVGSVYDVFNLGHGYANVYTATPGSSGTVTDTFVTPFGKMNLDSLFGGIDAAAPLQPGNAFTGLADTAVAKDAFTIAGYTLDPVSGTGASATEGFTPVASNAGAAPLLNIGGISLGQGPAAGDSLDTQDFNVYDGTGASATNVGSITTGEDVTNLLGMTNTQLFVTGATAAAGDTSAQAAALPAKGTLLDAFNLGHGWENVYTATAGAKGTVTDTVVTPYGNINLDSLFAGDNAANPLNAGAAFTGLQAGDSSIGTDAFTLAGTTFDPQTANAAGTAVEGFAPVYQVIGAPPLLNLGGGVLQIPGYPVPLATQDFNVYSGSTEIGSITTSEDVNNLLGLSNTEFTVTGATAAAGDTTAQAAALPTQGSVYDVLNLGSGWENIYTAIPNASGSGDTVTDTLVTPFGNMNLDSLFGGIDAAAPLDPGAAFTGVDLASTAASAAASDPLAFLGL